MKKIVLGITGGISFLIFLILLFTTNYLGQSQLSQTAADRWSSKKNASQVSCFFSVGSGITEDALIDFEHTVDSALADASVVQESENPGARLWADAYSADGTVNISSDKASITADAIGIGGDFFLFHPVQLLRGAYFSGNDLMYDKVIVDEDAAWQLFGSNDVVGMAVNIGGTPHYISGVIKREEGRFQEAAGLDKTLVYVSCETLEEFGKTQGINSYEVVMPNPVKNFAYNSVKEKLGIDENHMWVVENSARFHLKGLLTVISEFGMRSMNARAIQYPYWENVARGWEDVLAVVLILQILFLLCPAVIVVSALILSWKRRQWTWKDVGRFLVEQKDRAADRFHSEKSKWKYF